jgi:hypothetical protein
MDSHDISYNRRIPLRQFTDECTNITTSATDRLQVFWFLLSPVLIIGTITLFGIYAAWIYQTKSPLENGAEKPGLTQSSVSHYTLGDSETFRRDYVLAKSGTTPLRKLEKISFEGNFVHKDNVYIFRGSTNLSGKTKIHLLDLFKPITLDFHYGKLVNEQTELADDSEIGALYGITAVFDDAIINRLGSKEWKIKDLSRTVHEGVDTYLVTMEDLNRHKVTSIRLNAKSMDMIYRIDTTKSGQKNHYRFSEYKRVNGVRLPFRVVMTSDSGQIYSTHLREISPQHSELAASDLEPTELVAQATRIGVAQAID